MIAFLHDDRMCCPVPILPLQLSTRRNFTKSRVAACKVVGLHETYGGHPIQDREGGEGSSSPGPACKGRVDPVGRYSRPGMPTYGMKPVRSCKVVKLSLETRAGASS